jgi:hypothetical protein
LAVTSALLDPTQPATLAALYDTFVPSLQAPKLDPGPSSAAQ